MYSTRAEGTEKRKRERKTSLPSFFFPGQLMSLPTPSQRVQPRCFPATRIPASSDEALKWLGGLGVPRSGARTDLAPRVSSSHLNLVHLSSPCSMGQLRVVVVAVVIQFYSAYAVIDHEADLLGI